jgi:hypothetical protein
MRERLTRVENEDQARRVLDGATRDQLAALMLPFNRRMAGAARLYAHAGERPLFSDGRHDQREGDPWEGMQGVIVDVELAVHPEDVPKWAKPNQQGYFIYQVGRPGKGVFGQPGYVEPHVAIGHRDATAPRRNLDWTDWAAGEFNRRLVEFAKDLALVDQQHKLQDAADDLHGQAVRSTDLTGKQADDLEKDAQKAQGYAEDIDNQRLEKEIEDARTWKSDQDVYPEGDRIEEIARGEDTIVSLPGAKGRKAHYAIVSVDNTIGSHDPLDRFKPIPEYVWFNSQMTRSPLQPNDYYGVKHRRDEVWDKVYNFDYRWIFNTMPGGTDGPPVIRRDGIKAAGNSREFVMEILYNQGRGQEIIDAINKTKAHFGMDAPTPDISKHPIIVRILDEPLETREDLIDVGLRMNKTAMVSRDISEESAALANRFSQASKDAIISMFDAMEDDATLRSFMTKHTKELAEMMERDGWFTHNEYGEWVQDNELSATAKIRFENAFRGLVLEEPRLLQILQREGMRAMAHALDRSLPKLAKLAVRGGRWDIADRLRDAIRNYNKIITDGTEIDRRVGEAHAHGQKDVGRVDALLYPDKLAGYQTGFEGQIGTLTLERPLVNPVAEALMRLMERPAKEIKAAFDAYWKDAEDAEGSQAGMFVTPKQPWESFNQHIGS